MKRKPDGLGLATCLTDKRGEKHQVSIDLIHTKNLHMRLVFKSSMGVTDWKPQMQLVEHMKWNTKSGKQFQRKFSLSICTKSH